MILIGRLNKFPMSPSVNACYLNVAKGRISSPELKKFKVKAMVWAVQNKPHLAALRLDIEPYLATHKICLHFKFRFPKKKLWTKKDNKPKKLDASNRIKAAEDKVCEFLDFDDRYVYKVIAEKLEGAVEDFDVFIYAY